MTHTKKTQSDKPIPFVMGAHYFKGESKRQNTNQQIRKNITLMNEQNKQEMITKTTSEEHIFLLYSSHLVLKKS